jgi:hypothetical protein
LGDAKVAEADFRESIALAKKNEREGVGTASSD